MSERLRKILAHAGIASRRRAEQLIAEGRVRVNGHVIREMGTQADPRADTITVDGRRIPKAGRPTYVLLNKPPRVMSTADDPEGRTTVLDLVDGAGRGRLYPVGRLDFASEGLLILTNDGELTRFMTRAGKAPKVYRVKVRGVPPEERLARLRRGMRVEGETFAGCSVRQVSGEANAWLEITLEEGHNRQIRRMLEAIGHPVVRLRRTRIGFLTAGDLRPGQWRHLTPTEVAELYRRYGSPAAR
jgi:pseudouridine synthase